MVEKLMEEDYSSLDVAAALMKMLLDKRNNSESKPSTDFGDTGAQPGKVRFFVNLGRKQNVKAKDIVKAIHEVSGLSSTSIGRIDVLDKFSFIELPLEHAQEISEALEGTRIKGKRVNLELANKKK